MEQPQMKESDGPLKEALCSLKDALDSLCVLPRDIDKICPSLWERAYVDACGDGHFTTMRLASITPHYLTFRRGMYRRGLGWLELKVSRIRTGLGINFVLWRSQLGVLHCQFQEGEVPVGRREE